LRAGRRLGRIHAFHRTDRHHVRHPGARRATVDLGVLKPDQVNITVHGHEPLLAESLCIAAQEPEMLELARKAGAKGINLAGVCCTGNEILMRRGIPVAGGFIQQEMVLATGAVEAMVVDVQCVMQSVAEVAKEISTPTSSPPTIGPRCPAAFISSLTSTMPWVRQNHPDPRHQELQETRQMLYSQGTPSSTWWSVFQP
jgi:hydroxylamine reductase (hybrid-cluster protein)